jgi:hypothetical protein
MAAQFVAEDESGAVLIFLPTIFLPVSGLLLGACLLPNARSSSAASTSMSVLGFEFWTLFAVARHQRMVSARNAW